MYFLFRTRGRSGEKRISIMWYWCSKGINPNIAKQGILGSENTTVWNLELWGMIFGKDAQISLLFVIPITVENRPINFNFYLYR